MSDSRSLIPSLSQCISLHIATSDRDRAAQHSYSRAMTDSLHIYASYICVYSITSTSSLSLSYPSLSSSVPSPPLPPSSPSLSLIFPSYQLFPTLSPSSPSLSLISPSCLLSPTLSPSSPSLSVSYPSSPSLSSPSLSSPSLSPSFPSLSVTLTVLNTSCGAAVETVAGGALNLSHKANSNSVRR